MAPGAGAPAETVTEPAPEQPPTKPVAPTDLAAPKRPHHVSTIAVHPRRAEIDEALRAGESVRSVARRMGLRSHQALNRYASKLPDPVNPESPAQGKGDANLTIRDADRAVDKAKLHLSRALKSGDLKAANGAFRALRDAIELRGKAKGDLSPQQVTFNLTQNQQTAVDLHANALRVPAAEVTEQAGAWLRAQLRAQEPTALRIVGELVRMLPSADPTT